MIGKRVNIRLQARPHTHTHARSLLHKSITWNKFSTHRKTHTPYKEL